MPILLLCLLSLLYALFCVSKLVLQRRGQSCYLLAYECHKPPEENRLDTESSARIVLRNKNLGLEGYRFLLKAIINSGIGENTYAPRSIIEGREECATIEDTLTEMDEIMFDTLDNLFTRTGFSPSEIDILVVSVSIFAAVPSFTSLIINRCKLRKDIKAFNLGGMGCSGGLTAINLVQQLLMTYKNSLAIVVCSESMSQHWYCGKDKSMMLTNLLFRSGGCSMLLTNKSSLKHRAILKLKHMERNHLGANDEAYSCAIQEEDEQGDQGVRLTKSLVNASAQGLKVNLEMLMPKILPLWELARFCTVSICQVTMRKLLATNVSSARGLNFKSGIEHFSVHPGGRAAIDEIGKGLGLNDYDLEPSRMAHHRWGNTSSCGNWYALAYLEAKNRLKKGDRILMICLGAGLMCKTCVWEVMRDLMDTNVWKDCIDSYPADTQRNPLKEKYSWILDETLSFVHESQLLDSLRRGIIREKDINY